MRTLDFAALHGVPVEDLGSHSVTSVRLAQGDGESYVYCLRFEPGGAIGPHPTGFEQLFLVVDGAGWIAGADGRRQRLSVGHGAYLERGELHSKGSDEGMTAIMVQLTPDRGARRGPE